jgi:hypothetical protein
MRTNTQIFPTKKTTLRFSMSSVNLEGGEKKERKKKKNISIDNSSITS